MKLSRKPATAVTSSYYLEHAAFDPDSMEYRITEYNGNIETCYTPRDTTRRIFNSIGYWADSAYFYTVKDHLGNICAVVNAIPIRWCNGRCIMQAVFRWRRVGAETRSLTAAKRNTIPIPLRYHYAGCKVYWSKLRKILFCPQIIRINRNFRNDRIPD